MTNKRKIAAIVFALLSVFWIVFIFSNSLQPAEVSGGNSKGLLKFLIESMSGIDFDTFDEETVNIFDFIIRKLAHFSEFAVLSMLVYFTAFFGFDDRLRYIIPATLSFFVSCTDEIIQYFVPGRACRFTDVVIDTCGALTFVLLAYVINKYLKKQRGKNE